MNRRLFLQSVTGGCAFVSAGCVESLPLTGNRPEPSDVFENYRFEGTELVVQFRDGVTVEKAVLFDSATEDEYETIEHPGGDARFPVVFPDRLETYVSNSLRVKAKTPEGWTRQWVWEPVHGAVRNVVVARGGRARFEIESQGGAPLLVRFVGIYGDVPNPTIDPQSDSFEESSFDPGPSVVGIGRNRPLSPSRTDLVVPPGETVPFETTYAPFAFPHGAEANDCDGDERTAEVAVVHASGGTASYTFTFRLDGVPTAIGGRPAGVCGGVETGTERS